MLPFESYFEFKSYMFGSAVFLGNNTVNTLYNQFTAPHIYTELLVSRDAIKHL